MLPKRFVVLLFMVLACGTFAARPEHGVELESEEMELPPPPTFLDIALNEGLAQAAKSSAKAGADGRLPSSGMTPTEIRQFRSGLQHLTNEISALKLTIDEARKTPAALDIQPMGAGNAGAASMMPVNVDGQLYVGGKPVPHAYTDINKRHRGPVGRLKLVVEPTPGAVERIAKQQEKRNEVLQAKKDAVLNKLVPKRRSAPVDLSKPRGPVGRLKAESLPSPKILLQKLHSTEKTAETPSTPTANTPKVPSKPTKLRRRRGPTGRLKQAPARVAVVLPSQVKPTENTFAPIPLLAVAPINIPAPRDDRNNPFRKGARRGPMGKLKIESPKPIVAVATVAAVSNTSNTATTTATPIAIVSKPVDLSKRTGPVGRLNLTALALATKPVTAIVPQAVVAAPDAPKAQAEAKAAKQIKRLRRKGKRGPVGRLKSQPANMAIPMTPVPVPIGTPSAVAANAQALARAMFQKWVADYQQQVATQNLAAMQAQLGAATAPMAPVPMPGAF